MWSYEIPEMIVLILYAQRSRANALAMHAASHKSLMHGKTCGFACFWRNVDNAQSPEIVAIPDWPLYGYVIVLDGICFSHAAWMLD